ncbi:30S ribosomal protein S4e [Candidatus Woesearchaeota archaeon]|nr:30S ribosomal protein S4e [Candidatus Woesearchaeota archaeon]
MKSHIKRLAIPKSWPIKKNGITFITKPCPGPHPVKMGLPLKLVIRDMLGIAKSSKEVKNILHNNEILVDGVRRKDLKFPVGIMDVIEIKKSDEHFRVVLEKEKIRLIPIDKKEASLKPCKIMGKSLVKGKTQLNLYDGKNMLIGKGSYSVGDTVVITLPKQEIKEHIKLEKGCSIYLIGGKHVGDTGKIHDIIFNKVTYKGKSGEIIETLKKYVFVIGKDKAAVSLAKKK